MKYRIFTFSGEGAAVAEHLKAEAQDVELAQIEDKADILTRVEDVAEEPPDEKERRLSLFDGILPKRSAKSVVEALKKRPSKSDVFLYFDLNYDFKMAEALAGHGFAGNSPTEGDRLLEVERDDAKAFVEEHYEGLDAPEHHEFDKVKDGIDFLRDAGECFVLKGKDADAKTVVPDTPDPEMCASGLISALERDKPSYEKAGFVLERRIYDPIELTPEIQFYDGVPVFATLDLEDKQLGAGNVGEMTGCTLDLVFPIPLDCDLVKLAFPERVYEMAKEHPGWFVWDASVLYDPEDDRPYFGEFCANRPGYNSFYTTLAQAESVHGFFEALKEGRDPLERSPGFGASVRLFNLPREYSGLRVDAEVEWKPEVEPNLWLMDVKKGDGDKVVTAGYTKDFAVVTGTGGTPEEAFRAAYKNVASVSLMDMYYRADAMWTRYPKGKQNGSIMARYNYALEKGLI